MNGHRHNEGGEHFVAPKGASSLVKHFFQQSNADTSFGRRVAEVWIELGFDSQGIFSRFLRLIPGGGESDLSAALRLNLMRLEINLKFRQKSFNGNCCLCIFST